MAVDVVGDFGFVQIADAEQFLEIRQRARQVGGCGAVRGFPLRHGLVHLPAIGVQLTAGDAQRHGVGGWKVWIGGGEQFGGAVGHGGEGLASHGAGLLQVEIPAGRFGKSSERGFGFVQTGDIEIEADAAFRADGELAGALRGFEIGDFRGRKHFDDGEAGGQVKHRGDLAGRETTDGVAQFVAQGGGIDSAEQAAIHGSGVDGFLARQHSEIGAALKLLAKLFGIGRRVDHDEAEGNWQQAAPGREQARQRAAWSR